MFGRMIVAAALAGTTLVAGSSQAAACPMVTDPEGDTTSIAATPTPVDSAFPESDVDLRSADAWVAGGKLNVVLRMVTLPSLDLS
jgi:hypothetical protein